MNGSTIVRIWHGWTTPANADAFERTLTTQAIPSIQRNRPPGCMGIQLLRRDASAEVEFTTIMIFDSLESVRAFAGEDYEAAHIDESVAPLLMRYDTRVSHYYRLFDQIWE